MAMNFRFERLRRVDIRRKKRAGSKAVIAVGRQCFAIISRETVAGSISRRGLRNWTRDSFSSSNSKRVTRTRVYVPPPLNGEILARKERQQIFFFFATPDVVVGVSAKCAVRRERHFSGHRVSGRKKKKKNRKKRHGQPTSSPEECHPARNLWRRRRNC